MKTTFLSLLCFGVCGLAMAADSVEQLIAKGDAFDKQLKTREALAAYLEAEKIAPKNVEVLCDIAKEYAELMPDTASKDEKRKLGQQALDYAKRAVAIDPQSADAQLSAAICYGRLASLMDNKTKIEYSRLVKEHVDRAIKLNPSDDYGWHVLGAWNYELANLNAVMRGIAGLIYGTLPAASNDKAIECFKKAIEIAPQRVSHHIELGRTYAAAGKKDLARTELQKGLSLPSKEKDDEESKQRGRMAMAGL